MTNIDFSSLNASTTPGPAILCWCVMLVMSCLVAPLNAQTTAKATNVAALPFDEPLFDLQAIQNDPLDLKVLDEQVRDGLIIRKFEFTGEMRRNEQGQDEPVRITGLMVLPEHGDALPGLLWCQGGMSPANAGIPSIYAKKGYACVAITLPLGRESWTEWDASNPTEANLTRYGHYQLRAVSVLSDEPRVDQAKLGVAGASYGGFFSTLVAGVDPRIKAGAAFFAAGYHNMGTNLPQFNKMPDTKAVDTWMRTIDPAWRHQKRDMPFLWTLPSNDNWFYFPAVARTYELARSKDKRLAIVPQWTHGFPPNVDQQIFDWFDVHLKKTREPYIQPSALSITQTSEGLKATWTSDSRSMKVAQLVVSPNAPAESESPWLGQWVYRLHQPLAATLSNDGRTATAMIPVLDPTRPMLVYGQVMDEHEVITSTLPVLLTPPYPKNAIANAAANASTSQNVWRGCPWGELEPADVATLTGMAQSPGASDTTTAYRGKGSVRIAANVDTQKHRTAGKVKLFHVPHLAHKLQVAVRSASPASLRIAVTALPPANWQTPGVKALMGDRPDAMVKRQLAAQTVVQTTADWQLVTLDVPAPVTAIEGYQLQLSLEPSQGQLQEQSGQQSENVEWWFDSIDFTPVTPVPPGKEK